MKRRTRFAIGAVLTLLSGAAIAAEGMWTLDNLPRTALKERYGFEPDDSWVQRAMQSSVRLASGCSGSFVSDEGLVLTNAHCVLRCVQELSSADADYVNEGLVADERDRELRCPTEELNRLEDITDVTARIDEATAGKSGQAFIDAKNAEKARIESECVAKEDATRRCDVVELYSGSLHHLYRYRRFQDVRLVFSPEYRVGFFGGDPDNFNFPRYNLDMALLRAYENGKPAKSDAHFTIKRAGAEPGELILVTGHPGTTRRQLTVAQLERLRDVDFIENLAYMSEQRALLWQYSRGSDEARRQAQTDLTLTENSLKVLRGQLDALLGPALFKAKRDEEARLRQFAAQRDAAASDPWAAVTSAQMAYRELEGRYLMVEGARGFYSQYFQIARHLVRAAEERNKPSADRLREYQDAALPRLEQTLFSKAPIYPVYETNKLAWSLTKLRERLGPDEPMVKLVLARDSPEALAAKLVAGTRLGDPAERRRLWEGGFEAIAQSTDPFIELVRAIDTVSRQLRRRYENDVESVEARNAAAIARLRFEQFGTDVYPDATFTLRLSYGEVGGWHERGEDIPPYTEMGGIYARATGADPFALAPSWSAAREKVDAQTRFNFVSTADIIGGNSGSPILNRDLQIVGLAFDGNVHSLGGSFGYDESMNRCVGVHSAAMLEALDKIYGAQRLLKEIDPE